MRRWATIALLLSLLLASVGGPVGHDHGAAVEAAGYDCLAEHGYHEGTDRPRQPSSLPELRVAAEPHHHQCVGCHHTGQRIFSASTQTITAPSLGSGSTVVIASLLWAARAWTGRTLRGPPSA